MARLTLFVASIACSSLIASHAFSEEWKTETHGDLGLASTEYFDPLGPTNTTLETVRGSFEYTAKYGKRFKIEINPIGQADPLNHSPTERYWADIPAAYGQYQHNGWTMQLGFNTYHWGDTDGYNPLDIVSSRRLQDPLNAEKLGAFSSSISKDFGWLNLEAIYIPWQRATILPGDNSRWLPREVFTTTSIGNGSQSATLNLPPNLDYSIADPRELNGALENNIGLRAQFKDIVTGLDGSLEFFDGAATTPAIDVIASGTVTTLLPSIVIQADPAVTLVPVYYRQIVYGSSLVYANFGMIFRGEVAFTRLLSDGADLLGDSDEYVLGVEKSVTIGTQELTLIVQGTAARHSQPVNDSTVSLSRIFDRAGIFGLRYPISEKISFLGSVLLDTESHGQVEHVEASYKVTDAWKLGLAGDALSGAESTPIGTYRKNGRIIASTKLVF
jgi:hypothetical protein